MIVAATGHRPNKLGGYGEPVFEMLTSLATAYLESERPDKTISGMALGWDQAFALASSNLKIPFVAALPFEGQASPWPAYARAFYAALLGRAAEVVYVSNGRYAAWKMQTRNEWMVNHCDKIAALFDGSTGGTANCLDYAARCQKPVDNLWDQWSACR